MPAIPPDDYKGSVADWIVNLIEVAGWNGEGWHGDVFITEEQWFEILEKSES